VTSLTEIMIQSLVFLFSKIHFYFRRYIAETRNAKRDWFQPEF
jgi:hypothetical protein